MFDVWVFDRGLVVVERELEEELVSMVDCDRKRVGEGRVEASFGPELGLGL